MKLYLLVVLLLVVPALAVEPPSQIHLSTTSDPSTSISVTWQTPVATDTLVQYGTSDNLNFTVHGKQYQYEGYGGYMHTATLSLSPATRYYYRVGDGINWSAAYSFKTAPVVGSNNNFTVVVWGDQGYWAINVPNAAESINPDLAIIDGDLAYTKNESKVDVFFNHIQPLASKTIVMAAVGNHEYDFFGPRSKNLFTFINRFTLPGNAAYPYLNERAYSINYGNAHFSFLDLGEEPDDYSFEDQWEDVKNWLERDLASMPRNIVWKVIVVHFNLYASASGNPISHTKRLRQIFEPVFRKHGIDLVIQAHEHKYERTYPLADPDVENNQDTYNVVYETGEKETHFPVYLVVGTGGNCCYNAEPLEPWSAINLEESGYTKLIFSGNTLQEEFYTVKQDLRDRVIITKNTSTGKRRVSQFLELNESSFDFSLFVVPPLSIEQGSARSIVVNATQLFGPISNATLAVWCRTAIACQLDKYRGAFNFSSTLHIAAYASTPIDNYKVLINITSGGLTKTSAILVSVVPPNTTNQSLHRYIEKNESQPKIQAPENSNANTTIIQYLNQLVEFFKRLIHYS